MMFCPIPRELRAQLVEAFSNYSPAPRAAAAYAGSQVTSSTSVSQVDTQS
jgi:hypothetical protein